MIVHSRKKIVHTKQINMVTINILFNRRGTASEVVPASVEIEVCQGGKRKRFSTGVKVCKNQWRNGKVVKRTDYARLNKAITSMYERISAITEADGFNIDNLTADTIKEKERSSVSFCDWLDDRIRLNNRIRTTTKKQHMVVARAVREFGKINTFSDVNLKNIKLFDDFVHYRVNTQSSVYGYHKRLKPYIKEAVQLGLITSSPYSEYSVPRGKAHGIKYLLEPERMAIENLELSGYIDTVRDMFIFACYTGFAYVDIIKIKKDDVEENNGEKYIIDRRQKTDNPYKVMLLPKALEILEKHNYNFNICNQMCNKYLKIIALKAGLNKNLTMHMGRHTFATWALRKGVRIEVVSKMLAHADIETTQIYAKVLQEEVDEGFKLLK